MDFTLIEHHPWYTAGIVLGGGILLYLVFRSPSSSGGSTTYTSTGQSSGTDLGLAQINAQLVAQNTQASAYVRGLELQGATNVSLAVIGADVTKYTTGLQAEVTDFHTASELTLGLATLNQATEQAKINAWIQGKYIDALVGAFQGNNNPAVQNPPIVSPTPYSPNPTVQNLPPVNVTAILEPIGTGGGNPINVGGVNPGTYYPGMVKPGDTPLTSSVPNPNQDFHGGSLLSPPDYGTCQPWDSACVMANQNKSINYYQAVNTDQAINNRNQCLANAELSRGRDNYSALVSACG